MKKHTRNKKKPVKSKTQIEILTDMYKASQAENAQLRSALSTSCVINQLMQHPEQICSVEFYIGDGSGKVAEIIDPEIGFLGTEGHPILAVRPRMGKAYTHAVNGQLQSVRRQGIIAKGPSGFELIKATAPPAKGGPVAIKLGTVKNLPKCSQVPGAEPQPIDTTEKANDDGD